MMKNNKRRIRHLAAVIAVTLPATAATSFGTMAADTIPVTEANYSHAETARNFSNWTKAGAHKAFFQMQNLPPRGPNAPTVQMNDDTLYGVAIVKAVDGKVSFSIPETDNYMAVQLVTENAHGQQYVVGAGEYNLELETDYAFMIYRSGTELGLDVSRASLAAVDQSPLNFATDYVVPNYDFEEVKEWTKMYVAQTTDEVFTYFTPRTVAETTDIVHWNQTNANGWGASPLLIDVANKYQSSLVIDGSVCHTTTFEDPKSKYFTSITPYTSSKYLFDPKVDHLNSYKWDKNSDGTITVSFNCGADAVNNIDTRGQDFQFTVRQYGVSKATAAHSVDPIIANVKAGK